ncbi:hypothetical protein B4Q13_17690, partial [Lacticaseibacillus rhamnosus]
MRGLRRGLGGRGSAIEEAAEIGKIEKGGFEIGAQARHLARPIEIHRSREAAAAEAPVELVDRPRTALARQMPRDPIGRRRRLGDPHPRSARRSLAGRGAAVVADRGRRGARGARRARGAAAGRDRRPARGELAGGAAARAVDRRTSRGGSAPGSPPRGGRARLGRGGQHGETAAGVQPGRRRRHLRPENHDLGGGARPLRRALDP